MSSLEDGLRSYGPKLVSSLEDGLLPYGPKLVFTGGWPVTVRSRTCLHWRIAYYRTVQNLCLRVCYPAIWRLKHKAVWFFVMCYVGVKLVLSHRRKNICQGTLCCSYPCTVVTVSDKPQQKHGYEKDTVYRTQTGKKCTLTREHQNKLHRGVQWFGLTKCVQHTDLRLNLLILIWLDLSVHIWYRMGKFANKMWRKISGPVKVEGTGDWRKLCKGQLCECAK